MNKKNLSNYIKLCKRKDLDLIINIADEINLGNTAQKIADKYSVSENEINGTSEIMKVDKNVLIEVYEQYLNKNNTMQMDIQNTINSLILELNIAGDKIVELNPAKFHKVEELLKSVETDAQTGGASIKCSCCDCSKDGYIFTNEEDQKCVR